MKALKNLVVRVIKDESGASMLEYALLAALIAVVAVAAVTTVGTSVRDTFTTTAGKLQPAQ
jgi:pilus assembly protein Flp/PilA